MKKHRYPTETEFVREVIRDKLNELEKDGLIKRLADFKGNFKGKNKMSEEEAGRLASLKITKKFGINLD